MNSTMVKNKTDEYIDFDAIIKVYDLDNGIRMAFNELFAVVSLYLYWDKIYQVQEVGAFLESKEWIEQNIGSLKENHEKVYIRTRVLLAKIARYSTKLNSKIGLRGCGRFIIKKMQKNNEGAYDLADAKSLALEIAENYYEHFGKKIADAMYVI